MRVASRGCVDEVKKLCGYTHHLGGSIFRKNPSLVGNKRQNMRKRPPRGGVCYGHCVIVMEYRNTDSNLLQALDLTFEGLIASMPSASQDAQGMLAQ
jgi:hypothetical protein